MKQGTRGSARTALVVGSLVALSLSACGGSRLSHEAIVAAGVGGIDPGQAGGQAGAASTGGGAAPGATAGPQSAGPGPAVTGSGAGGGSASGGGGVGGGSQAADNTPIVIGTVSNESGPAGAAEAAGPQALIVWAQWINDRGGINGHPVKVLNEDDNSDPSRQAADVQNLVENQHVVALVDQWASLSQSGSASYIDQHHIPVVGGDLSTTSGWGTSAYFFPQATVADNAYKGIVYQAAAVALPQGKKNLGVLVCVEAPTCTVSRTDFDKFGPQAGFNVVYDAAASSAAPDYTSECLQAQQKGVQVLWAAFDVNSVKRVAQSCSRQGFSPTFIVTQAVADASNASIPAFEGAIGATLTFPFIGISSPATDEFRAAFAKYAPQATLSPVSASGWAASKLFEKAASLVRGPVTTASLAAALWTMRNETVGGLTIPLTFVTGRPTSPPPCVFPMAISGGRWIAPNGDSPVCRTS